MKDKLSAHERQQANFWDQKSKIEDFKNIDWPGIKEMEDFFKFADLGERLKILEIGGGTGRWTIPLLKKGHEVTSTEISQNSFKVLKEKVKKLKIKNKPALVLSNFEEPIFEKRFDVACCFGVIHHFDPKKREKIIENIIAALKDEGKILIIEPNPLNILFYFHYFWRWLMNMQNVNRWRTEKYFLGSTVWHLIKILQKSGIREIEVTGYGFLPTRFARFFPPVLEFNRFMNFLPIINSFSAFIWIKGTK